MRPSFLPKVLFWACALALPLGSAACSKKPDEMLDAPDEPIKVSSYKVSGKVTYLGKPVPYGYVVFFTIVRTSKSVKASPPAMGKIKDDGTYEIDNAPEGPVMVSVVTDPEVELGAIQKVATLIPDMPAAPPGVPGGPGGAPPGGGPPGGMSKGPPGGGPGGAGGVPKGPGGAPKGPGGAGGAPKGPGGPKGPPPGADKLTEDQKKLLKQLNEKYGVPGRPQLTFPITGKGDQTYNIEMTLDKQ